MDSLDDCFALSDVTTEAATRDAARNGGPPRQSLSQGPPQGPGGPLFNCPTLPAALLVAITMPAVRNISIQTTTITFLRNFTPYEIVRSDSPQARRLGAVYCRTRAPFGRLGI